MTILVVAVVGFLLGAALVFILVERRRSAAELARSESARLKDQASKELAAAETIRRKHEIERKQLEQQFADWQSRKIKLEDRERECELLKAEMSGSLVQTRKLRMDRDEQETRLAAMNRRAEQLAEEYLKQTEQWVARSINANNYAANKKRLSEAVEWCQSIGFRVPPEEEARLLDQLKRDFESEVKKQIEREEQAKIKAQIREEQAREREVQKELERLEREQTAIRAALDKALAETRDQHSTEIEQLRARLAEAESRERAVSQAQLTRAGHIYVISNIGSFGEGVFKIGMTRRLEPLERVAELGDASVPFPFDVHMMISCEDAPRLENELHKRFGKHRLNRVNPRKEYFRLEFEDIRKFVEERQGEVRFAAVPEASEYRQSLTMSEEDQAYIDRVFDQAESRAGLSPSDD